MREGEHPLAVGDVGKNLVDEVRGEVGHASAATGRAEATSFAREGDELVRLAAGAPHAREAEGEQATGEVALELAAHEARQAVVIEQEGGEVLAQDAVQSAVLRLARRTSAICVLPGGHAREGPRQRAAVSARVPEHERRG
jgi:hypothetical protein